MSQRPHKSLQIVTRAPLQLGQAIERLRKRAKLTQAALAKKSGLRQATISKVEKGMGTTEIETIYAISAALGMEIVIRPRGTQSSGTGDDIALEDLFES